MSLNYYLAANYNIHPTYIQTLENDPKYSKEKTFKVLDMGEGVRKYSPIRITVDEYTDRMNEGIMAMNETIEDLVVKSVHSMIKDGKRVEIPEAPEQEE